MAQPVIHFEISASNREKSVDFYSKLFDWKTSAAPGFDYSLVEPAGNNSIGGGIGATQGGQKPFVTFYVGVDDLQATLDKAESLGAKTILPPTPIPGIGACALFADPDGIVIGLFKG